MMKMLSEIKEAYIRGYNEEMETDRGIEESISKKIDAVIVKAKELAVATSDLTGAVTGRVVSKIKGSKKESPEPTVEITEETTTEKSVLTSIKDTATKAYNKVFVVKTEVNTFDDIIDHEAAVEKRTNRIAGIIGMMVSVSAIVTGIIFGYQWLLIGGIVCGIMDIYEIYKGR